MIHVLATFRNGMTYSFYARDIDERELVDGTIDYLDYLGSPATLQNVRTLELSTVKSMADVSAATEYARHDPGLPVPELPRQRPLKLPDESD